jgi:protein-S-isoprenylcysteine O-methyltransferase Ste14
MAGDLQSGPAGASNTAPACRPAYRRFIAVLYGGLSHSLFVVAIGLMLVQLYSGLLSGWDSHLAPRHRIGIDLLLLVQFPLIHSWLLARKGRRWLLRLAPNTFASDLSTTTFAAVASLQILLAFGLWVPSGIVWWQPRGATLVAQTVLYAAAWLFLIKALWDAGLGLQTGALGWRAVFRGRRPEYGSFPRKGLFRHVRQPVYLGFILVLWTGPVWTPDHLLIALVWTTYCLVGARLKERRYSRLYAEEFDGYRSLVPYLLPGRPAWRRRTADHR